MNEITKYPSGLLICLGIMVSSPSFAQESKDGFKGANVIVITAANNDSTTYDKVIRTLIDAGFSIDVNNKDYFQLKTGPRTVPCAGCDQYVLMARVKDSKVFITANIQGNFSSGYSWSYSKSKLIKDYSVHEEIIKILGPLGQVSYLKQ